MREKREEGRRVRSPAAARLEAARGGLATTAGGSGRWVALGRRPRGVVAVKGVGESTGELGGSISPLTMDWNGAERLVHGRQAWRRSKACGGGAAWLGRELEAAEVAVGRRSGAGGLFIGRMRRWGGAG